jgi:hypothetical protein
MTDLCIRNPRLRDGTVNDIAIAGSEIVAIAHGCRPLQRRNWMPAAHSASRA